MNKNQNITGTYQLIEYGYSYKKTNQFKPISDFYSGVIQYGNDGLMSVSVRFSEKPELDDVVAYFGRYQVLGQTIKHEVFQSARPSYEGQILERNFRIEDHVLYTEFENTDEFIKFARWKKMSS